MEQSTFDATAYKESQSRDWSSSAEGWRRWWRHLERSIGPVGQRLLELAEVRPGQRILDVATGIGEPAVSAARMVGSGGKVVGIDIAPAMLVIAAERAAEGGLDNVEFREMDAEALDFPEASFDVVLCRFGLMFLPDAAGALSRIRALLVPGGRLAASVWGPPERAPGLALTAVARVLGLPPPTPGTPGIFSLSDPQRVQELFLAAGLSDVVFEWLRTESVYESVEERLAFAHDINAPLRGLLAKHDENTRQRVWEEVAKDLQPFVDADGRVHLWNDALLVSGRA